MSSEPSDPDSVPLQDEQEDAHFFQTLNGRSFNTLNQRYMLPADQDEVKVHSISTFYSALQKKKRLTPVAFSALRIAPPDDAVRI
jgi:hypothetical protein